MTVQGVAKHYMMLQKYVVFIGIDVSRDWVDVSTKTVEELSYLGQFSNTEEGISSLLAFLKGKYGSKTKQWIVCFENTGQYSQVLCQILEQFNIDYCMEHPLTIERSMGFRRGKTDKDCSQRIARYVYKHLEDIRLSQLPKNEINELKLLISRRRLLVKQKGALKVSMAERARAFKGSTVYLLLKAENEKLVHFIKQQIKSLDKMIVQLIKQNREMSKNYFLLLSIKGIGPVIAAYLLMTTKNFTCFSNARKLACYCGIAPFSKSSGKHQGKARVSKISNRQLNSLLGQGAMSAMKHDNQIRIYYERKLKEGKEKGCIVNAIKNKLLARAFAVIKRQSPYVPLANYI